MKVLFNLWIFTGLLLVVFTTNLVAQQKGDRIIKTNPTEIAEQQTVRMTDRLGLSEEQVSEVKKVNLIFAKKVGNARKKYSQDRGGVKAAILTILAEKEEALMEVLSEEQFALYTKLQRDTPGKGKG